LEKGRGIEIRYDPSFPILSESQKYRNPGKSFLFDTFQKSRYRFQEKVFKNDISGRSKISFSGKRLQKRYQWEIKDIVFERKISITISAAQPRYRNNEKIFFSDTSPS